MAKTRVRLVDDSMLGRSVKQEPIDGRAIKFDGSGKPRTQAERALGSSETLVCIGASTGGTDALKEVLRRLPPNFPPVMVAQHMPETFTKSFAHRLDELCTVEVKEALDHEQVLPGRVYLAPGHSHLLVKRCGVQYYTELSHAPPVNRLRPSVDVLFNSAAEVAGACALGVILTGMGKDGAQGLLAMRRAGAYTLAQDEASCVVYGMPRAAIEIGAVQEVAALREVAARLLQRLAQPA